MSLFIPTYFAKNVTDISINFLNNIKVKGIMLDIDDTLVPQEIFVPTVKIINWVDELKNNDFKLTLVSNNKEKRVSDFANHLDVPYVYLSSKPFTKGIKRAINIMELPKDNVIMVGDQIFTDILAANFMKIKSILIDPIAPSKSSLLKFKRLFEKSIKRKFINKQGFRVEPMIEDNIEG